MVHPVMKNLSSLSLPIVVSYVYDFLSSAEHKRKYLE